ncbi:MAG: nucleotide exchange factor GrpE [Bacteroidetes bacterium]|nr:nucleotide exchange factor GrpE [Bacteroidota bacterium]
MIEDVDKTLREEPEDINEGGQPEQESMEGTDKKTLRRKKQAILEKENKELKEKVDELNDKYLRLFSEFDNFRKRTLKEKIEMSKTASEEVITALLPVLDDFERAIRSMENSSEDSNLKEGVLLIFNKFLTILNQKGLEQMRTVGEVFDTDYHEAITNIPAPSPEQKGRVIDEVEKGYLLNGKVIRYARVVVGN